MRPQYDNGAFLFSESEIYLNRVPVIGAGAYHAHNFIEIAFVESGRGLHIINGNKFPETAGDIAIIDYDIPHKFISLENETLWICNCVFQLSFLDKTLENSRSFQDYIQFSNEELNGYKCLYTNEHYTIASLYENMLMEFNYKKLGYQNMLRGYLLELLVFLLRADAQLSSRHDPAIERAATYIIKHYNKPIEIDRLAKNAFLSKTQFCRRFKQSTGMTVTHFLQKVRVDQACRLLVTTERKVLDIAEAVGYKDSKHFYEVFHRFTGRRPSDFRKS